MNRGRPSDKRLDYLLKHARDQIASEITLFADPGTPSGRANMLQPLHEVILCEHDQVARDRLMFIYGLFVAEGLRLAKGDILRACLREKTLYPAKRSVEDVLGTLRGEYEALRFLKGECFVAPEYFANGFRERLYG